MAWGSGDWVAEEHALAVKLDEMVTEGKLLLEMCSVYIADPHASEKFKAHLLDLIRRYCNKKV